MTAPTIRAYTINGSTGGETTSVVTMPTVVDGDHICLGMTSDSNTQAFSMTGTWNKFFPDEFIIPSNHQAAGFITERVAASEPATVSVTLTVSERQAWILFSVMDTAGLDGTPPASNNGNSNTVTFPAVVTSVNDCLICRIAMVDSSFTALPFGAMTGFTKVDEIFISSGGSIVLFTKVMTTAGTEAAGTSVMANSEQWVGWTFAWSPSSGHPPLTLGGAIGPTGGLAKLPNKLLSGDIIPSGVLLKSSKKLFAGVLTPSGSLLKKPSKTLSGTVVLSGTVSKKPLKLFFGSLGLTGSVTRQVAKIFGGSVSFAGALIKQPKKIFAGSLGLGGDLILFRIIFISLSGSLSFVGGLRKTPSKLLSGSIQPQGLMLKRIAKMLGGSISPSGTVSFVKTVLLLLSGSLSFSGNLLKQANKRFAGSLSFVGILSFISAATSTSETMFKQMYRNLFRKMR